MVNKVKYFQDDLNETPQVLHENHQLKLQVNDILYINVITNNEEINEIFAIKSSGASSTMAFPDYNNGIAFYRGFKINMDGNLSFPIIGDILANGLTLSELENSLRQKLFVIANEVNVVVKLANFRVTILGDVKESKSIIVPDEKITIHELLGLAGDVNMTADLKNVVLIRENNNKTEKIKIDLSKSDVVNCDKYFLKQNDVLYIPPKNNKFLLSNFSPYFGSVISGISLILSLTILLKK
jgi:polysaccharide export outer membrane protein